MDIKGKTVLVLGGWGLVGSAVCRRFMEERPRRLVVTSLRQEEALDAVAELRRHYPDVPRTFFVPWWGNIFLRTALKDMPRERILNSERYRDMIIEDMLDELGDHVLKRSSLYGLLQKYRPDIVVDCVNTATAIAYQDLFQVSRTVMKQVRDARKAPKQSKTRQCTGSRSASLYGTGPQPNRPCYIRFGWQRPPIPISSGILIWSGK